MKVPGLAQAGADLVRSQGDLNHANDVLGLGSLGHQAQEPLILLELQLLPQDAQRLALRCKLQSIVYALRACALFAGFCFSGSALTPGSCSLNSSFCLKMLSVPPCLAMPCQARCERFLQDGWGRPGQPSA